MTPREKLVVIYDTESNSRQDLLNKMYANKIEKLIAVDVNNYIYGLVNLRDIEQEHSS
jgi:predicted transcriptional regulator